jgi:UDP-N-acetylmuramyl pentapeptide phosphotransferase/UDP-N-acetylglucosamine-1-phosphate transferase
MNRVDTWTLTGVLVFVGVVFPFRAWWDFHHPENWSPGSADDPQVYLWAWASVAVFVAWVAGHIALLERKRKLRARLKALLVRAEALVRQHRRDEAAEVLKECEEMLANVKST